MNKLEKKLIEVGLPVIGELLPIPGGELVGEIVAEVIINSEVEEDNEQNSMSGSS